MGIGGASSYLTVPSGEDGSQDLPVLPHLVKLLLQGALHMGIGHHVSDNFLLQHPPQRPLIGTIEFKPNGEKKE